MRDPERIDRILKIISLIWHTFPDMRLGQLLYNFANFKGDIFNYEDDFAEMVLSHYLKKVPHKKNEE